MYQGRIRHIRKEELARSLTSGKGLIACSFPGWEDTEADRSRKHRAVTGVTQRTTRDRCHRPAWEPHAHEKGAVALGTRTVVVSEVVAAACARRTVMALNLSAWALMASLVGSRSIEEAPKKPTTPGCRQARTGIVGLGDRPQWHIARMFALTLFAASCIACRGLAASGRVMVVRAPMVSLVLRTMCATRTSRQPPGWL